MMSPRVSIISIVGATDDIRELFASLQDLAYPSFDLLLVDNRLSENAETLFQDLLRAKPKFPVRFFRNPENLGFAAGNNVAIRHALQERSEYLLLLNDDTVVEPLFLARLVQAAQSSPSIGIAGPTICFADRRPDGTWEKTDRIWFGGGKVNWLRTQGRHLRYGQRQPSSELQTPQTLRDTDYVTGCCLLIKTSVVERISPMREEYFLYYEDTDWCLAARRAGYRAVYVPDARVWHKVSRSAKAGSASYVYYHVRNGWMLARRYGNGLRRFVLWLAIGWTACKQLVKYGIPAKRSWAKAALQATMDFCRGKTGRITTR